jgi:sugar phosphate isomerase/epimerase
MQVGVCTISAKSRPVESIIEYCGDLGVDGVEVWGEAHVGDGSAERCREIATAAADSGVAVPVYGSYLRPGGESFDAEFERELAIADRLGADLVRVWAGEQEYEDCDPEHWDRVVADLDRLGTAARERELAVTVERHAGTVTNATAGARKLIERVDSPAVGLNWQPLFAHDGATVVADARELAALANNVHLQAVPAPGGSDRCALAESYFDVATVIGAFDDAGLDGFLEVEFVTGAAPYEAALAADVAFLRALV